MKKFVLLLSLVVCIVSWDPSVNAADLLPFQVGNTMDYVKHDSDTPQNNWTVRTEIMNTVTIGSNDYFNVEYSELGFSDYHLFRSTMDTVYYYGSGTERPFWRMADVGTTWSYLDPDGVGTAYAEIVDVNTLGWEDNKETLTVPYGSFSFDNLYIHKKYYETPDKFWYEYLVPGLGVVKDVNYEADENPPHVMELTAVNVVPEPVSSALFIIGGATLGFRRFRKKITLFRI